MIALKSGQYSSSYGALRTSKGFCPLGVLCDISKLAEWEPEPKSEKMQYLGQIHYLPKQVAEWAGISAKERSNLTAHMITYTDHEKFSLSNIADFLINRAAQKK